MDAHTLEARVASLIYSASQPVKGSQSRCASRSRSRGKDQNPFRGRCNAAHAHEDANAKRADMLRGLLLAKKANMTRPATSSTSNISASLSKPAVGDGRPPQNMPAQSVQESRCDVRPSATVDEMPVQSSTMFEFGSDAPEGMWNASVAADVAERERSRRKKSKHLKLDLTAQNKQLSEPKPSVPFLSRAELEKPVQNSTMFGFGNDVSQGMWNAPVAAGAAERERGKRKKAKHLKLDLTDQNKQLSEQKPSVPFLSRAEFERVLPKESVSRSTQRMPKQRKNTASCCLITSQHLVRTIVVDGSSAHFADDAPKWFLNRIEEIRRQATARVWLHPWMFQTSAVTIHAANLECFDLAIGLVKDLVWDPQTRQLFFDEPVSNKPRVGSSLEVVDDTECNEHCVVCLGNGKTHVFVPCGHLCVCENCAAKIMALKKECPLCTRSVEQAIKVFF